VNKQEFLKKLEKHLRSMPKAERDDIIGDFLEYFECAEDKDEAALCERLGDPRKLAKEYQAQSVIASANETKKVSSMLRAFAVTAGLGSVNFLYAAFIVPVGYITLSVFFIVAVVFVSAGLLGVAAAVIYASEVSALLLAIFVSIGTTAFGLLMFIGNIALIKVFNKANMAFLNNISQKIRKAGTRK